MFREIMMISRDIVEQQVSDGDADPAGYPSESNFQERIRSLAEKLNGENQQLQVLSRVNSGGGGWFGQCKMFRGKAPS